MFYSDEGLLVIQVFDSFSTLLAFYASGLSTLATQLSTFILKAVDSLFESTAVDTK